MTCRSSGIQKSLEEWVRSVFMRAALGCGRPDFHRFVSPDGRRRCGCSQPLPLSGGRSILDSGDILASDGNTYRIRLEKVDSPESAQKMST